MILVKLMGGMGNQMFQYAFAKSLASKCQTSFEMDLSFLKRRDMPEGFVYRNYDLDIYKVEERFADELPKKFDLIQEPHYHYSQQTVEDTEKKLKRKGIFKPKDVLLEGYWQSPKYFKDIEQEIRKNFCFKDSVVDSDLENISKMYSDISNSNSVMINVRRADYLDTDTHGVMGLEFIQKGIDLLNEKISDPKYFIFSDDVEWCKENVKLDNMVLVDHTHKGEKFGSYLELMKSCKHFIIPNSTFAWWAAWLCENENKIVIAPKRWFTDEKINTTDIIPDSWIRI